MLYEQGDGEPVLDRLGVRMRQGELLRGTFHVGTQVLDVGLQLLVHGVLTLVVVEVVILYLRVLLPCVGFASLWRSFFAESGKKMRIYTETGKGLMLSNRYYQVQNNRAIRADFDKNICIYQKKNVTLHPEKRNFASGNAQQQ